MWFEVVVSRPSAGSDSDSDYGARSKKKKKPRVSADEIRVSSRGGKIPNYVDDVQDFEAFDEDDTMPQSNHHFGGAPAKEEDEIEQVLSHSRDEGHEDDPEDVWYANIVCRHQSRLSTRALLKYTLVYSVFTSSGRISPISIIPTKSTNF